MPKEPLSGLRGRSERPLFRTRRLGKDLLNDGERTRRLGKHLPLDEHQG